MGKGNRRRRELTPRDAGALDRPEVLPGGPVRQGEFFPEAIIHEASFEGPLPPPALLRDYDTALPGLGERIVRMAETEGDHRRVIERRLVGLSGWGLASGTLICLVALVGGFLLLSRGRNLSGLAPIILALGGVIATLVLQRSAPPPADTTVEDTRRGT